MMNESQTDLFSQFDQEKADHKANEQLDKELNDEFAPLASRMRPKTLEEYVGQSHLLGEGRPLRTILNKGQCYSMILWGPPGVGKTTLALLFAKACNAHFEQIPAVT